MKKFWLTILAFLLSIVFIFLLTEAYPSEISYRGTAMEYSPVDESVAIPHEVVIEGIYHRKIIGKDYFLGTFYISDIEGLDYYEYGARLWLSHKNGGLSFRDESGGSGMTELFCGYSTRYFRQTAFTLAENLEFWEDGASASADFNTAHFIVLDAQDRDEALSQYKKLQQKFHVVS